MNPMLLVKWPSRCRSNCTCSDSVSCRSRGTAGAGNLRDCQLAWKGRPLQLVWPAGSHVDTAENGLLASTIETDLGQPSQNSTLASPLRRDDTGGPYTTDSLSKQTVTLSQRPGRCVWKLCFVLGLASQMCKPVTWYVTWGSAALGDCCRLRLGKR